MNKHCGRESQWARFYYKYEFRWGLVHMYSNILLFPGLFFELFF